jgi:lipoprotein-anchoring transpeptidase ErfK/SrfK
MGAATARPLTHRVVRFFGHGGGVAYYLIGGMLVLTAVSSVLFAHVFGLKLRRDVARLVLEDGGDVLEALQWGLAATGEATRQAQDGAVRPDQPYLVVSTGERRLWYKQGDDVLFTSQVATGSGKSLVKESGGDVWLFETPRGRLSVISKEENPVWSPPDWHYVEQARKRKAGLVRLERGQSMPTADGSVIRVAGDQVVRTSPGGEDTVLTATDGREIVVDGKLVVPPLGTSQRRYEGVLGTRRLNLGNGYALHGTNNPASIGQAVSHGCVRLRNEDIEKLYAMVSVGTPVYIY